MKTIKVTYGSEIPENFIGIAEFSDGSKRWYKEGSYHREDGPALESPSGTKQWFKDGKRHREDGPAIEYSDGEKHWYKEGKLHREDGPALEYPSGTKQWFKYGKRHREDGPAVEWRDGSSIWSFEDQDYDEININDFVVLDYFKGKYDLMWYRLLGKDKIFEYPDIPGLITK